MSNIGQQLAQQLETFQQEHAKFEGGNSAAGTRARKALMEIKKLADNGRKEIQEKKNAE
jgi:hypothetical protein